MDHVGVFYDTKETFKPQTCDGISPTAEQTQIRLVD